MKKMFAGIWGGTMLLTESDAGSDVGALTTTATTGVDILTFVADGTSWFGTAAQNFS